jgi:hypothetical protein
MVTKNELKNRRTSTNLHSAWAVDAQRVNYVSISTIRVAILNRDKLSIIGTGVNVGMRGKRKNLRAMIVFQTFKHLF